MDAAVSYENNVPHDLGAFFPPRASNEDHRRRCRYEDTIHRLVSPPIVSYFTCVVPEHIILIKNHFTHISV